MPISGTALVIAIGVSLAYYGGVKAVHGIKHVVQKTAHVLHHPAKKKV